MASDEMRGIKQRAGFIEAATGHRDRHLDTAREARDEGRERAAKYHEGRAKTYSDQIVLSAKNIKKIATD